MNFHPSEAKVYEVLNKLGILYTRHEHPAVFTVEQASQHWTDLSGAHCKNLFLRNKKGTRHYLVILLTSKQADLKQLNTKLKEDRLSFGSAERLEKYLGLTPGAVSPFGLINDSRKEVIVIVDQDLRRAGRVNFHPNINTVTLGIGTADFERFLASTGNGVRFFEL
jgi:Ala-tRNA(Pro) deacylase